ncbi:hypothetical protein HYALB_00003370 [Hymenoscyphus albidus]|uniref:Heterokaryon incompatibility domain-containing protein n=1 Tax=Hymenoscyphus albidus TaxID=595503 RepID=A0A9N9LL29_9HELO|nr:hypothetical protein HYALB_00003370 [Hymenoscyphus albidus]
MDKVAISLLESWPHKCSQTHAKCGARYDFGFRPTRLIDVGSKGKHPRLVHTAAMFSKAAEYLALSHCWGTNMPSSAKTTLETLSQKLTRIRIRKLPRTFQDAIAVTRRLGLKYLWIDSLCIIQDSHEDWQLESALMRKIYSHCYCTLAAAASLDCHGGLFAKRSELAVLGTESPAALYPAVLLKSTYGGLDELFSRSPLNSRGWTLQERELSPRMIYFTKHTMLFECRRARGGERGESRAQAAVRCGKEELVPKTLLNSVHSRRCMDEFPLDGESGDNLQWRIQQRYHAWRKMVQGYSQRHLSVSSDKFPGLSGLASELSFLLNDHYVAGLWKGDIVSGLPWSYAYEKGTNTTPQSSYGPSWSWAKMNVPINYDLVRPYHRVTQDSVIPEPSRQDWQDPVLLNASTVPAGRDPNGTLISAFLQFWGQITSMRWSKMATCVIQGESIPVIWDFLPQSTSDFFLFSLGKGKTGLVLVQDPMYETTYRRVGIVSDIKLSWFRDTVLQSIKLV